MSKNYYYLISSLPFLQLDDYKEPYRVKEFIAELKEYLSDEHWRYVREILYLYDYARIVEILTGKDHLFGHFEGNLSFGQLQKLAESPEEEIDARISRLLDGYRLIEKEQGKLSRSQAEEYIFGNFYSRIMRHEAGFIREYFRFDFHLRNILSALNARKLKINDAGFLRIDEEDYIIDSLKRSTVPDFGLSGEIDYLAELIEVFNKADLVYSEKFIDQLRWRKIDEINTFKYFEIDVLLGYLIKLILVERWIALDEKKGEEVFNRRVTINKEIIY
ncbi:MAG: DUF2764 family protein [Candidatus Omnitrophica bacterium]|nr:DUF2764 family protein [Candidatus Omnitrophota bacterium]